ncbi:hypothetical protein CAL7716_084690 [Calothrix sp. PCC 7716]|nr:hypothetical protein CAL7716_084690 [Calothrix sp. PCC 7716]
MITREIKTTLPATKELNQYVNQGAVYENVRDTIHVIADFLHDINRPHWLAQALSEYRYSKQWSELEKYVAKQQDKYPQPTQAPSVIWYERGILVKTESEQKLVAPARIATRQEFQSLLEKSDIRLHQGEYVLLDEGVFELGDNLCPLSRQYYSKPVIHNS